MVILVGIYTVMRTIRINQKAAAIALGSLFFILLLIFYSITPRIDDALRIGHKILLARDINARSNFKLERFDLKQMGIGNGESHEGAKHERFEQTEESSQKKKLNPIAPIEQPIEKDESSDDYRSNFIRQMARYAWNGYKKYAWGKNEVRPIALTSHSQGIFGGSSSTLAATIVDALDTLLIMQLKDEYNEGREFIKNSFKFSETKGTVSVFETTIRFIGGFLSAYALTNDTLYIDKSVEVADVLLKAFNTQTGLPTSTVNVATGAISNYGWANGGSSILAEIGTLHLEFVYLSHLTKNPIYKEKVQAIRDHLDNLEKLDGLYPNYISSTTGQWSGKHVSLGAMGDSFYEYLIKSYIQTGDTQAWRMYNETIEAIVRKMVQRKGGLTYVAEWRNGVLDHKMGHLACFCVGMFALQSDLETDEGRKKQIMDLAEELGNTCHESYIRSATGLGPEMFYFAEGKEAKTSDGEYGYILRPEVIEGWFYLWRLTNKPLYKEWVWNAVSAIEKYCKKEGGYAGLINVYSLDDGWDDVQQSFFIAETLKYAYLTFMDKSVVSLSDWVFNTEAHPFPILVKSNNHQSRRLP